MAALHLLDVPYDCRSYAKWAGARWDGGLRKWVYRGESLPQRLVEFSSERHSFERWLEDDLNGRWPGTNEVGSVVLHPHQQLAAEAVERAWIEGYPGFLLADQVGLGKSYSTIAGVNRTGSGLNVLVLAPLSVVPHWRRSIDTFGDGDNRWCVTNYERAKGLLEVPASAQAAKRTRTKNKRIATSGRSRIEWDIIICDEAHRLKNPGSQRSHAVRQLIKSHGSPAFVIWLSATAGQNPVELAYLAPLLAAVTGSSVKDLADFEDWCTDMGFSVKKGAFGQWQWEPNDSDLTRMRSLLFDGDPAPGLRRRPEEIAGWPSLQRVAWPVDLDREAKALYDAAWEEFRRELQLSPTGADSANAMVAALRFRQKASLLRVQHTADIAEDLIESGMQVAVSAAFIESSDALVEALAKKGITAVTIDGRQSSTAREAQRLAFQTGEVPAVVFTVTEGISLHAGEQAVGASSAERAVLIHDLRWSALDIVQIEGRCHRDGQAAIAYHLFAGGTVEARVAEAMLGKLESMAVMLGDDTTGLDALVEAARS